MTTLILSTVFIILLPLNALLFVWHKLTDGSTRFKQVMLAISVISRAVDRWRTWSFRRKKFWVNFVLGICVVVIIQLLTPRFSPLYTMSQGFGFDWFNKFEYHEIGSSDQLKPGWNTKVARYIERKLAPSPQVKTQEELTYGVIAIGDATQQAWGAPSKTPRDKLTLLLTELLHPEHNFDPKMVIIDIDFQFDPNDPNNDLIFNFLKKHAQSSTTPILLVRSYKLVETFGKLQRTAVPTFLDNLPDNGAIWWASARVVRNSDNIVRNFVIGDVACGPEPAFVPSIPVVVDYLSRSEPEDWQELRESISSATSLTSDDCAFNSSAWELKAGGSSAVIDFKGVQRQLETTRGTNKLILSLNPEEEHKSRLSVPIEATSLINSHELVDTSALKDRIVIIGATHSNANDVFETSVGKMQGMYYLLNAIESLHTYGQIRDLGTYFFLLLSICIVAVFSWIASRFSPLAGLLAALCICILLSPVSFVLYPLGIWFEIGIPLIAIQGNQLIGEFTHSVFSKKVKINDEK